jgi:hypothetical protein
VAWTPDPGWPEYQGFKNMYDSWLENFGGISFLDVPVSETSGFFYLILLKSYHSFVLHINKESKLLKYGWY